MEKLIKNEKQRKLLYVAGLIICLIIVFSIVWQTDNKADITNSIESFDQLLQERDWHLDRVQEINGEIEVLENEKNEKINRIDEINKKASDRIWWPYYTGGVQ